MKQSIGKKLLTKGLLAFLLIALLISASQVVVNIFKKISNELVVEYHEMNALQEFNLSLARLLISINNYPSNRITFDHLEFRNKLTNSKEKLATCQEVVTEAHDPDKIINFNVSLIEIENLSNLVFSLQLPQDSLESIQILNKIHSNINELIVDGEMLVKETKTEITEYEGIYNTVVNHGNTTILTLGVLVIVIIIIMGWRLIKNITTPIKEFVIATNKIGEGNRMARVNIETEDEFQYLAESFNKMVHFLDETTVSKDYLDNILKNMFNSLIVTDNKMLIRSVNQATLDMLNYKKEEILGLHIYDLLGIKKTSENTEEPGEPEWTNRINRIKNRKTIRSNSGKKIPALISCNSLRKPNEDIEGLIIVGYDLTQQKGMEDKIEKIRKKRSIEINEAQEEEKIRIATDLHDGLGQMLTAISFSVSEMIPAPGQLEERTQLLVNKTRDQINAAINETKNLAYNLIPIVLKDFGLITAIDHLIQRANDTYDIQFSFNAFDFEDRIDTRLEKTLYRISQEALNNIVKHAQAKNAIFQIYRQYKMIVLVIEDDGKGFDFEAVQKRNIRGIGLISIQERVQAFDGNLTINSDKGKGTEIIIEIPCPKRKKHEQN